MKIAVPAETNEARVAATPETVKKFIGLGATFAVQAGAGTASRITDAEYQAAGATIAPDAAATVLDADIVLNEDYAYPEYGLASEETLEAIRLSARLEGMLTDPVYEGKSMQGMIDLVKKGFFPTGSKVLYAHLGGVPAINGYSYLFRNG